MSQPQKQKSKIHLTAAHDERGANEKFFDYYANQSLSASTAQRVGSIRDVVLQTRRRFGFLETHLDVADVGCNAGTQCIMWAQDGHRVHGVDINANLVSLARQRSMEVGLQIDFREGSATRLPWETASMDICLAPELLEHVRDWEPCVNEFCRVLKIGGILYLSTTNWLCPKQYEFQLPLYSWYPALLKKRYERLAVTTKPQLVNFAEYPAVNWFSFYGLRQELTKRGFTSLDRFDSTKLENKSVLAKFIVKAIRKVGILRLIGHVATPYTVIVGIKRAAT
jgi:2-polyprenyl-3-methyl-5-hydroxy-6-metoxy-1,4-benzoquinol methylase